MKPINEESLLRCENSLVAYTVAYHVIIGGFNLGPEDSSQFWASPHFRGDIRIAPFWKLKLKPSFYLREI